MFRFRPRTKVQAAPPPPESLGSIAIDGRDWPVLLTRSARARRLSLRADPVQGGVRVTGPLALSSSEARRIVEDHRGWLTARLAGAGDAVRMTPGATFAYLGEAVRIDWAAGHPRNPTLTDEDGEAVLRIGGPQDRVGPRLLRFLKAEARRVFAEDLAHYCAAAGVAVPPLALTNARGRWGSCSAKSGIRIHWRLIMAPPMVRRSVIAHEVAHLTHMNHSAAFYTHLDRLFEGDRAVADRWLKRHGTGLRLISA